VRASCLLSARPQIVTPNAPQRHPDAPSSPFLYIDARGNFHILYHVYRTGPVGGDAHNCLPGHDGAVVSGHYFSEDGLAWFTSPTQPYGNTIALDDGSTMLLTTRERPKMLFNAAGEPTHLSNGVCPSPGGFNTPFACPTVSTGCTFNVHNAAPARCARFCSLTTLTPNPTRAPRP
jgi:hypothetical protein